MAVRKRHEDVIVGTFIVISFLYPFFISFLIWTQENKDIEREAEILKEIGFFLLGRITCTEEKAILARILMSEVLKEKFSKDSLIKLCIRSRVKFSHVEHINFNISTTGDIIRLKFYSKEVELLSIKAKKYDNRIEVMEFSYGKGD